MRKENTVFRDWRGDFRLRWVISFWLAALAVVVFLIVIGVNEASMAAEKNDCIGFGQASGRHVEFSRHGWFSFYCLTPANDGKLIPVDALTNLTTK